MQTVTQNNVVILQVEKFIRECIAEVKEAWEGSSNMQGDGRFKDVGSAPGTDKHVFGDMLMAGGGEAVQKMARRYEEMQITVRRGGEGASAAGARRAAQDVNQ